MLLTLQVFIHIFCASSKIVEIKLQTKEIDSRLQTFSVIKNLMKISSIIVYHIWIGFVSNIFNQFKNEKTIFATILAFEVTLFYVNLLVFTIPIIISRLVGNNVIFLRTKAYIPFTAFVDLKKVLETEMEAHRESNGNPVINFNGT